MKKLSLLILLLCVSNCFAELNANFALKDLTSQNILLIKKDINASGRKTVYFQDGAILISSKVDKNRLYCSLENIREKVGPINLNTKQHFKFDNNDFLRTKNYISLRIWQGHWLFGQVNGDVQV
ncbi:hypothetical protein N9B72_00420, partial [Bacteriovoracaceae bacterium]|nr:hypothetical protein [Bacteriovoracaceae bacterium]MDA9793023.1 hypothetical protein [Bacteriovoracaceae bacterium]